MTNPMMGEIEIVYELKMDASGKITGEFREGAFGKLFDLKVRIARGRRPQIIAVKVAGHADARRDDISRLGIGIGWLEVRRREIVGLRSAGLKSRMAFGDHRREQCGEHLVAPQF